MLALPYMKRPSPPKKEKETPMTPPYAVISEQLVFEEDVLEEFGDLFPHLSEEGHATFVRELMATIKQSRASNDLRPLREVIEAWYRTMLVRSSPEHNEKMKRAIKSRPRRRYTAAEIRERLGR